MNDNYRPSEQQIDHIYECEACHSTTEVCSIYGEPSQCRCGGHYRFVGESYPASSDEWDEQRDPDGEWRERRY